MRCVVVDEVMETAQLEKLKLNVQLFKLWSTHWLSPSKTYTVRAV